MNDLRLMGFYSLVGRSQMLDNLNHHNSLELAEVVFRLGANELDGFYPRIL